MGPGRVHRYRATGSHGERPQQHLLHQPFADRKPAAIRQHHSILLQMPRHLQGNLATPVVVGKGRGGRQGALPTAFPLPERQAAIKRVTGVLTFQSCPGAIGSPLQGFQGQPKRQMVVTVPRVEGDGFSLQTLAGGLTLPVALLLKPLPLPLQCQRALPLPVLALPLKPAGVGLQAQILITQPQRQFHVAIL